MKLISKEVIKNELSRLHINEHGEIYIPSLHEEPGLSKAFDLSSTEERSAT